MLLKTEEIVRHEVCGSVPDVGLPLSTRDPGSIFYLKKGRAGAAPYLTCDLLMAPVIPGPSEQYFFTPSSPLADAIVIKRTLLSIANLRHRRINS